MIMKTIKASILTIIFAFTIHSTAVAQADNFQEVIKQHFNKTVQQVKNTDDADEKRAYLDDSFARMLSAIDRIEDVAGLSEEEAAQLLSFRENIEEKKSELNGLDGFDEIADEDLDDFSNYSQEMMEQANRTITISITTALLIVLILLLL